MTISGDWEIFWMDGDWCALKGGVLISAYSKTELEQKLDDIDACIRANIQNRSSLL